MRKLTRVIVFMIVVLIVFVLAGAIAAFVLADRVVASAVESAGSKVLNVPVTVGRANVSILGAAVDLQNITVANPPGYEEPALLKLQRVDVVANTGSLLGDHILIKTMTLANMEVFVEQKGLENNLYEVVQSLRRPREPTGRTLVIDRLEITNITVRATLAGIPGRAESASFTLPKITMTDLGKNEKMDTSALIGKIVLAVASGIAEQGGGILPKEALNNLAGILDKAFDIGRIILDPGQPNRQTDLGKTVTEGLKGLLSGAKKQ